MALGAGKEFAKERLHKDGRGARADRAGDRTPPATGEINALAISPAKAPMSSDRVIIDAINMAQPLLWQNLAPTHNLPDATAIMRFRDLVRSLCRIHVASGGACACGSIADRS
jgi:hypothetical protein